MEKLISKILNKYLGDWLENLNSEQLNISLFRGSITLENLTLKTDVLHILGLPFDLTYGSVKSIHVKIPWKNLLSSPLIIEISDVYAYMTPKLPSSWSESSEIEALNKAKKSKIEQFEAFETESLSKEVTKSNFAKRSVLKIVENVQIVVKNIYIRFEDHVSTSDQYAFGIILKELRAETCDQNWKPMFVSDEEISNKLVTLTDFSVFLDYKTETKTMSSHFPGPPNEAVEKLAKDEFEFFIHHNYLLKPFSIEAKFVISKQKNNFNIPLVHANVLFRHFEIHFHSGHIKLILKFLQFLKLYQTFKVGIERIKNESQFETELENVYRENYRTWTGLIENDKKKEAEKVRAKLKSIEDNIVFEEILRIRSEEISKSNKSTAIEKLRKEKADLEHKLNKKEGPLLKIINKKKERKEKKEKKIQDILQKIDEINAEIERIEGLKNLMRSTTLDAENEDPNWQKIVAMLTVVDGQFRVFGNTQLLASNIESLVLGLSMKEKNISIDFQIFSLVLYDTYLNDTLFPKLFELSGIVTSVSVNPLKISASCSDIYVYVIFPTIFEAIRVFKEELTVEIDISDYQTMLESSYNQYIEAGQNYLMNAFIEKAPSTEIVEFSIDIKAPIVVVPIDPLRKSIFLRVDFGKFLAKNSKSQESGLTKESVDLNLLKFEVMVVWNWKSLEDLDSWTKINLLAPISISSSISRLIDNSSKIKQISIQASLDSLKITINSLLLTFFSDFSIYVLGFLPKKNKNPVQNKGKIKEIKGMIETFKDFQEIIPVKFGIILKNFDFSLNGFKPILYFYVFDTCLSGDISSNRDIDCVFQITSISLKDKSPESCFPDIIRNPYLKLLGIMKNTQKKHQLQVTLKISPNSGLSDICVLLEDLRLTVSVSFIASLLEFVNQSSETLSLILKTPPIEDFTPTSYMHQRSNLRITAMLKNFEFWVPSNSSTNDTNILHMFLTLTCIYTSSASTKYVYGHDDVLLETVYLERDDELDVTLSHFGADLRDYNETSVKEIILPGRISLETRILKKQDQEAIEVSTTLRIECICVVVGFESVEFFKSFTESLTVLAVKDNGSLKENANKNKGNQAIVVKAGIEIDSLQFTVVDDTQNVSKALFYIQFCNISLGLLKSLEKTELKGEIILFINNYNQRVETFEPTIEDIKFIFGVKLESQTLMVEFFTEEILNFNFSYSFATCLGIFMNNLKKNRFSSKNFEEIKEKQTKETTAIIDSVNFEYEIVNRLEIPVNAWLSIGGNSEVWKISPKESHKFPQRLVDKLNALSNKKSKSTLIMNNIHVPTKLAFQFSEKSQNIYYTIIDEISQNVITASNENSQFLCFIHIDFQSGKRCIVFETAYFISNNTSYEVNLIHKKIKTRINPFSLFALPIDFTLKFKHLKLEIDNKEICLHNSEILIKNYPFIVSLCEYKFESIHKLTVIDIQPKYFIKNLLNCTIFLCDQNKDEKKSIEPGEEVQGLVEQDLACLFKLVDPKTRSQTFTEALNLTDKSKIITKIEGLPESSLRITSSLISKNKFFALELENHWKISNKEPKSRLISISADYIIVNQTLQVLNLSGLEVPMDELRYFSSDSSKFKLKMKNFKTNWSKKFGLVTAGVSEVVKVTQKSIGLMPRHFLFGLSITNAPHPLVNSKIITFAPRFMIWNYLGLAVFIKQHKLEASQALKIEPFSEQEKNFFIYNPDDCDFSKSFQISANAVDWSGPISLENFDDFQIQVVSEATEHEKKASFFTREWYMPKAASQIRYIRIIIKSIDDATLHISLLNPKDPDFRIVNNSDQRLQIKQKGLQSPFIEILPNSSQVWVWEDFLERKKKVELVTEHGKNFYSIEKIKKHNKKKISGLDVYVSVKDITRELVISNESLQGFHRTLSFNDAINPRHGSVLPTGEISNILNKKSLFSFEIKEMTLQFVSKLSGIGISIFDTQNNENLYVVVKGIDLQTNVNLITQISKKDLKIDLLFSIEHLQIDSMDSSPGLFPVIFSPIIDEDDLINNNPPTSAVFSNETSVKNQEISINNSENYEKDKENLSQKENIEEKRKGPQFFKLNIKVESTSKKVQQKFMSSMTKIECLEIFISKFQLKINLELIMKLLNLKHFAKAFHYDLDSASLSESSVFSNVPPVLSFDKSSVSNKIYFHSIRVSPLSFLLTLKKGSEIRLENEKIRTQFFLNLIKSFGGGFANLSQVPFNFSEVSTEDSFRTGSDFVTELVKSYISQGLIQFYKIFGSIDIIGNPLALVDKFGTGVVQLFTEPAKGIVKGPMGFAKGLSKGSRSFVSGVVGGSFESVSKISGTLYNVIKNATGDQVIEAQDEESIGKNLVNGLKETTLDVYEGITGVVTRPYWGIRARSFKAFFLGLFQGLTGLATFPIKIVLKLSNVITNTVASTAFLLNKLKIKNFGRQRFPRHMKENKIIESYNFEFAQAQAFLNSLEKYKQEKLIYFAEISLAQDELIKRNYDLVLLITPERFLYIINGELYKAVVIHDIIFLEYHQFKDFFVLGIVTAKENFSIPCKKYSSLACIFNTLGSFNNAITHQSGHKFKRPKLFKWGQKSLQA